MSDLDKILAWQKIQRRTDENQFSHDHTYDEALDDLVDFIKTLK